MKRRLLNYKPIILLLIVATCHSCTRPQRSTVNLVVLQGRPVAADSGYYYGHTFLLCGNLLFTRSLSSTATCNVSQLFGDSLINWQEGFRRGHGRNEFQEVALGSGCDSSVYIAAFPSTFNRLLSVTKTGKAESIGAVKAPESWIRYDLTGLPSFNCTFNNFNLLSDSTMLVLGAPFGDIEHLMTIINFKNQTLKPLDYWPEDNSPCGGFPKHSVYTDNCKILKGADDRFLYICGEGNFAFIFGIKGTTVKVIKELYSLRPEYDYMGDDKIGRMNYTIKNRPTRRFSSTTNDSHIYLFQHEKDKDGNIAPTWRTAFYGNIMEVYDWEGNLEKKMELDELGFEILVTESDDLLYLFAEDKETGEPQIWAYDLRD